jgi:hypothetical protein
LKRQKAANSRSLFPFVGPALLNITLGAQLGGDENKVTGATAQ